MKELFKRMKVGIMRTIAPVCESERQQFRGLMKCAEAHIDDVNRTLTLRSDDIARMMAQARMKHEGKHSLPAGD